MKQTKSRKLLAILLTLMISLSLLPLSAVTVSAAPATYEFWDLRNTSNITQTTLTGTVIGTAGTQSLTVERYTGYYVPEYLPGPGDTRYGEPDNSQKINIFVPDNATPDTGILFLVQNGGWTNNDFVAAQTISPSFSYDNTNPIDFSVASSAAGLPLTLGLALERGMVIVSYGCRSRANGSAGDYYGHSPATMTDTKAAIRFLRYNYYVDGGLLQGYGNPNNIFVTGSSGGGALSVILAASGNSPDYYDSLYEIGAAGIEPDGKGGYIDTLQGGDSIFGTMAYCPITDLPMADQAYEFTYNTSRTMRDPHIEVNYNKLTPLEDNPVMLASNWLAEDFTYYINGLELVDENGVLLTASFTPPTGSDLHGSTAGTFKDAMIRLLEKGIDKAIDEWNTSYHYRSNANPVNDLNTATYTSLLINGGAPQAGVPLPGSHVTIFDFDDFLTKLPYSQLKIAPAFDNRGIKNPGGQNENSLVGTIDQPYSHWHEYTWNEADSSVQDVGLDNSQLSWDQFLQTDDGALVALQSKMTTPIPYLLGAENIPYLKYTPGSDECDVAPYWYVRHGQQDRDTSFAVGTLLYYSLLANDQVKDDLLNFNFAWQKPHGGYYDLLEAYDWLDSVMAAQPKTLELKTTLQPHLDGTVMDVDWYTAEYVAYPYDVQGTVRATGAPIHLGTQQIVNVYVPENATADSPIILMLQNGGWVTNEYPDNTILSYATLPSVVGDYSSTGNDNIGAALKAGYVVVSYGCRSRGQQDGSITGDYIGHSPATVADTKAVISYLRWSADQGLLDIGNTDRIVVTGSSGGGALSTLICATGNSADFFEELYNMGTAGVWKDVNGIYHSDYGDDVFATMAYCPITDLPNADAAYEWTYNETRHAYATNGETGMNLAGADINLIYGQDTLNVSDALVGVFVAYFNSLNLRDKNGELLRADNDTFKNAVIELLKKGAEKAVIELDAGSALPNAMGTYDWLDFDSDGNAIIDWDNYLYWVGMQSALKYVPAFDNMGTPHEHPSRKENDLVGTETQQFSHWTEWAWMNDNTAGNGVGYDDTNLTWSQFLLTAEGKLVLQQIKMLNPMPYLTYDSANVDISPYWYVRHGMADRDTSFAVGSTLYYALLNESSVRNVNFNFAWLKPHSGYYDIPEAFEWFAEVLALADNDGAAQKVLDSVAAKLSGNITGNVTGLPTTNISYTSSNPDVASYNNGTLTINRPAIGSADATVTIAVLISGIDKIASDGINYYNAGYHEYTFKVPAQTSSGTGGGGGTTAAPKVDVGKPTNGNITVSNPNPAVGDKVIVTVKPNTGYKLDSLKITDKDGKAVAYTDNGDGTFTFTYEGSEVTIEAIFVPLAAAPEIPFLDVKSTDWFYDYVKYVYDHGLMIGTSEDEFSPNLTSSRAMIVTVLWRMAGSPATSGTNSFTDLTADWYKDAVQWAVSNGITNGMSATSFGPNAPVTREQLATFLYRFADFMGYDISKKNDLAGYTDSDKISDFAKDAMEWINAMGVITGENDTTLNPKGASTRAVLATVLARFCEAYNVFGDAEVKPDAEVEEEVEDEEEVEEEEEVVDEEEVADEDEVDEAA